MQFSIFFCQFLLSAQDLSDSRLAKDMLRIVCSKAGFLECKGMYNDSKLKQTGWQVAIVVVAVPEGLPLAVTLTYVPHVFQLDAYLYLALSIS
jgi:magnesium-transporting ATPase (P-type)